MSSSKGSGKVDPGRKPRRLSKRAKPSFAVVRDGAGVASAEQRGWVYRSGGADDPPLPAVRAGTTASAYAKDVRANEVVRTHAAYAAGAGLIPIPALDVAAIAGVELRMLSELAGIYDVPFERERVRSLVAAIIGGYVSTRVGYGIGWSLLKIVPVYGHLLGALSVPALGASLTWAIGRVCILHFASGGSFLDFDPAEVRAQLAASNAG
jgi:uncharacterized protein (DUF697 family)